MSNYVPLYISLGIIILLGTLMPLIVQDFIPETYQLEGFYEDLEEFIVDGIKVGGFLMFFVNIINLFILLVNIFGAGVTLLSPTHIDILFWLPNTFKLWLVTSIQSFTLIPITIQIPILLIVVIGLIWGGVKLFLP